MAKESRRKKRKGTPIEKMVTNGVENAVNEDAKPASLSNDTSSSKSSPTPVEDKDKAKSSTEDTPKEGSLQTVASATSEMSTEPTPEQEASRKR